MSPKLVWLLLLGFVAATAAIDDPIILKPLTTSTGPTKLLIIIQGTYVPSISYVNVSKAIQAATPEIKLWVGISNCAGNLPEPIEGELQVQDMIKTVKNSFPAFQDSDVFLSGHSLGGIVARTIYDKDFAGLILFGSYLERTGSDSLPYFTDAVLHLAGEIDGLTRITRIGVTLDQLIQDVVPKIGNKLAAKNKPVVILPAVTHSQFDGNGFFVKGDIKAEIPIQAAHKLIGEAVMAFMYAQLFDDANAITYLENSVAAAQVLLGPFWKATNIEKSSWCKTAQIKLGNLLNNTKLLSTTQNDADSITDFAGMGVNVSITNGVVSIINANYNSYESNPLDISTYIEAAEYTGCKAKRQAAILKEIKVPTSHGPEPSCQGINKMAFDTALNLLLPHQRARYEKYGKKLEYLPDVQTDTGITWLLASFVFKNETNSPIVEVQSPTLITSVDFPLSSVAGMHYCKLLSPARVVEFMLVDGLK